VAQPKVKVEPVKPAPARPTGARGEARGATGAAGRPDDDALSGLLEDAVPFVLGALTVVLARVVTPNIRDLFQLPKQLYLADGAALLVAMVGVLAWLGRPYRFRTTPMVWAGVAFIAAMGMSLVVAPKHTGGVLSIFARYDAHRWIAAAAIFWVVIVAVRRARQLWYLIAGLVAGGLVVSLIGIGEQHNIASLLPEKRWSIISKPGSTFGNRNMAAQVVVAMLPACYVAIAVAVRWLVHGRYARAIALLAPSAIALDLLLYYLALTVTRSAYLGAILGLVAAASAWAVGMLLARRAPASADASQPRPRHGLMGSRFTALVGPVAGVIVLTGGVALVADHYKPQSEEVDSGDAKRGKTVVQLLQSFFSFGSDHYRWRFGMLASSWEAMKAEPLGGGAGNWRVMYPKYLTIREKNEMFTIAKQPIRAHNDILQVGSEFGWHGLLALFALLACAFWFTARTVARAAQAPEEDSDRAAFVSFAAIGSLMGIAAIMGDAQASFPLQLPVPTFLFCLHLAIIAVADNLLAPAPEPRERPKPWPTWAAATTVAVGIVGLAFLEGFGSSNGLHGRWMIAERGFTDARNLQKRGQASAGLVEIGKAIEHNPDDFQNHFIEALCLNSLGRTKEAIDSLHRSLALYPNLLNAWVNVAMFSARIGDKVRMNEAIDKALALKPDDLITLNVRLNDYNATGRHAEALGLVAKQVPGYEAYRASGRWPEDDGYQLLGAYKQTLNHGISAARKLARQPELAEWLIALDGLGIPNDGRSEDSKRIEKRDRAADIAEALRRQGRFADALAWSRLAAELAMNDRGDLKRLYAVTLAHNKRYDDARRQCEVAVAIDRGERDRLSAAFAEVKAAAGQDAAALDQLVAHVQTL